MSNEQNYRPRSPDLSAFDNQPQPPPRLHRLPSYTIQEPSLPKGYSFSPRGSYDASPFFSPVSQQPPGGSYFGPSFQATSPQFNLATLPNQHSYSPPQSQSPASTQLQSFSTPALVNPYGHTPPRLSTQVPSLPGLDTSYQPSIAAQNQQTYQTHQIYSPQQLDEMARLRQRKPVNYNESHNGPIEYDDPQKFAPPPPVALPVAAPSAPGNLPPTMLQPFGQPAGMIGVPQQPNMPSGPLSLPRVDVKTKFPVARIKRIMQADEDVGKVAQATPSAVSKALELFMIALVAKGASEAKLQNSKRVTATHLKSALLKDSQFDFLNDICESVPDEGTKKRAKSETKDSDSDDEATEGKRKGKPRKKKAGSEMDSD